VFTLPYKSQNIKIEQTEFDKRIKLTPDDKKEILRLREIEGLSQRKLAAMFGVSRRLITFILDPAKHERNIDCRKQREIGYTKEQAVYMRTHRHRKQKLYIEGKIGFDKTDPPCNGR
jgi:predicted DNA-binding protein (UPF0251 family)